MQAGFACFESGIVRAKNSINVIFKNIIDTCLAGALFWLIGHTLMFGDSFSGIIGHFELTDYFNKPVALSHLLFQLVFCATTVTIVSGAI